MILASAGYLHLVSGWGFKTALLASSPGALSVTLALAGDVKADVPRVAVAQVVRVLLLVALVPSLAANLGNTAPAAPQTAVTPDLIEFGLLVIACLIGGLIVERLRWPTGIMLGAFAVSAVLHGTGWVEVSVPWWILNPTVVVLGAATGARFGQLPSGAVGPIFFASLVSLLLATAVAVVGASVVSALTGTPLVQVFVAYAPGGADAMSLMAFALGFDPAFVAVHHLARILALTALLPIVVRAMERSSRKKPAETD